MTALRRLRHARRLTQQQLADRAGVSLRTIYSLEQGRGAQHRTMRRVLQALGLRWEDREQVFPQTRTPEQP